MSYLKIRWLTFLLLPVLFLPEQRATAADLKQDFDTQIPGENPSDWRVFWGNQADDVLAISNMKSTSGANSIVIDRTVGDAQTMYGVGRTIPDMRSGWNVITFTFLVEGDGSNVSMGIEVRRKDSHAMDKALAVGISGLKIKVNTSATLSDYRLNTWHRLTCWLPTIEGKQTQAHVLLEERLSDGSWKLLGAKQTVQSVAPPQGYGVLMFNTHPQKRNFRFFVDDLSIEQKEKAPH